MKKEDVSATHEAESLSQKSTKNASSNTNSDENKWEAVRAQEENSTPEQDKENVAMDTKNTVETEVDWKAQYQAIADKNKVLNEKVKTLEQEQASAKLYHAADLKNAHLNAVKESEKAKSRGSTWQNLGGRMGSGGVSVVRCRKVLRTSSQPSTIR